MSATGDEIRAQQAEADAITKGARASWEKFGNELAVWEQRSEDLQTAMGKTAIVVDGLVVPPPTPTPVPPASKWVLVKSLWDPTMTDWHKTFGNWGKYANTYDSAGGQRQDAVSLDQNARVQNGLLLLDLKLEKYQEAGHAAFDYTGISLRTPDTPWGPGLACETVASTPGVGRYGLWASSPAAGDDSECDGFEQFPVPDRGGRPAHRRFAVITDYTPTTQQYKNWVDLSPGEHTYLWEWGCKADPANIVYSIDGVVFFKVPKNYISANSQSVLLQAQCGGEWGGGKYANPTSSYAAPAGSGLPKANSTMTIKSCRILRDA